MHRPDPVKLVPGEPIAFREGVLLGLVGKQVPVPKVFEEVVRGRLPRLKVEHHVKRRGAAQVLVDVDHALIDVGIVLEVVDEAVVHGQLGDPCGD